MLMDDPISALDVHVRREIFNQVLTGVSKDKTRILVTHAIDYLHLCDRIVLMNHGHITAQGSFTEL
jgi:ATP-binding cassette, subfamily C (CFTR/MRP), member 1